MGFQLCGGGKNDALSKLQGLNKIHEPAAAYDSPTQMWPFSRICTEPFDEGDLRESATDDGWRRFAELWNTQPIDAVHAHANKLKGAEVDSLPMPTPHNNPSFTFRYKGLTFAISQADEYLFFIDDPACDNAMLLSVARHFNKLLHRSTILCFIADFGFKRR